MAGPRTWAIASMTGRQLDEASRYTHMSKSLFFISCLIFEPQDIADKQKALLTSEGYFIKPASLCLL